MQSTAGSAILFEPRSGRVLYEKQAHVKRPMASTTKLMTALLAAERLRAEDTVCVTAKAVDVIGTKMGLQVGETVSRDALLRGLLLSSGNDAANVLALAMAPDYESFATLMNERAAALGMEHSRFVTPSGLDADGHGSTAYDMALLASAVLENPTLAAICREKTAQVTVGDRTLTLTNHNKLLSMYPDAVGMKTGYTSLAGRCLVSAAIRDGVTLIVVTLNCRNDWNEHMTLLDEGFSLMTAVTLSLAECAAIPVFGAERVSVTPEAASAQVIVPSFDKENISTQIDLPPYIWAPVSKGDTIGYVHYCLHGDVLATIPITVNETVVEATTMSYFQKWQWYFRQLLYEVTVGSK